MLMHAHVFTISAVHLFVGRLQYVYTTCVCNYWYCFVFTHVHTYMYMHTCLISKTRIDYKLATYSEVHCTVYIHVYMGACLDQDRLEIGN